MPTNRSAVDPYTAAHLGVGTLVGAVGTPLGVALALTIGWEILEPKLKRSKTWKKRFPDPTDDSLINSVTDSGAFMGGWWLGKQIRGRRQRKQVPADASTETRTDGAMMLNLPIRKTP